MPHAVSINGTPTKPAVCAISTVMHVGGLFSRLCALNANWERPAKPWKIVQKDASIASSVVLSPASAVSMDVTTASWSSNRPVDKESKVMPTSPKIRNSWQIR